MVAAARIGRGAQGAQSAGVDQPLRVGEHLGGLAGGGKALPGGVNPLEGGAARCVLEAAGTWGCPGECRGRVAGGTGPRGVLCILGSTAAGEWIGHIAGEMRSEAAAVTQEK